MCAAPRRKFLSIYFPHRLNDAVIEARNVCVAFNMNHESLLYREASRRSTTELKRLLAIHSYDHLQKAAAHESRSIGHYIKLRLSERLANTRTRGECGRHVRVNPRRVAAWIQAVEKAAADVPDPILGELSAFLARLIETAPGDQSIEGHSKSHSRNPVTKSRPVSKRRPAGNSKPLRSASRR